VVAQLCDALVDRGHSVTLFASGDSVTRARLRAPTPLSLRLHMPVEEHLGPHVIELAMVAEQAEEFDVIHFHLDYLGFLGARFCRVPSVHTLHGRLDMPVHRPLYEHFKQLAFVSISDAQREPLRDLDMRWLGTVPHGLPLREYPIGTGCGGYLAFLGRVSPEKRPDLAIEVARRTGIPLKIAAKVDLKDRQYFETVVRPLLGDPLVDFIGEIGGEDRNRFLGEASALLFPIDWPEPFGLVMIEALACGTPVVAMRRGSVPEVIADGRTGFIVDSVDEMVDAVRALPRIDRRACRADVERRFSDVRMAIAYERVYRAVLAERVSR
jgi:glycosyltransferase involved in cell wall biosynthesis